MNYRDPELREALVAEYVLGTLQGVARQRFERLMYADFRLRQEVERWQNDLYPGLIEPLPEELPPARVWQAISEQTKPEPVVIEVEASGFWANLRLWRSWSALATAMTLVLAIILGQELFVQPTPTELVAVLNDGETQPAWLVRLDPSTHRLSVQTLRTQSLEASRSFQLWLLPGAEQAPQSLGLIPASGEIALAPPLELLQTLGGAAGLAVSLEPEGGSPTGLPTGPVLYQGKVVLEI